MAHSTVFEPSDELREAFGQAINDSSKRWLRVTIDNEKLILSGSGDAKGSFEEDFDTIGDQFQPTAPCYIIYRIDDGKFLLLFYVPDKSKVKEKMLYASSRATLKRALGGGYFEDEVFGTVADDFSLEGYQRHKVSRETAAPLTEEEEMKKEAESGTIHSGGQTSYVHGVSFPVADDLRAKMDEFSQGSVTYVRVYIDIEKEVVMLDEAKDLDLSDIANEIHKSEPRFHFFNYKHTHDDEDVSSVIYLYSSPDGSGGLERAPIKHRMLYSSSKAAVGHLVEKIDLNLEINSPEELSVDEIVEKLHPPQKEEKKAFARPSRPGRGARARPTKKAE